MIILTINLNKALRFVKRMFAFTLPILVIIFVFLFIDKNLTYTQASASTGMVIIIDAGHGGEDSGAVGVNGVYEKDINLEIALLVGEELKERGFTVVYTRTEDKMLYLPEENIKGMRKISDLKNRCKIANGYDDCVLISIHMNSFGSSKYSGLQVYYQQENDGSRLLAEKIQSTVRNQVQKSNNRQIKPGRDLYLLENCSATSVIIECGFLSNEAECKKLSEKEYQKELSFSIVYGIIEYIDQKNGA